MTENEIDLKIMKIKLKIKLQVQYNSLFKNVMIKNKI